MQRSYLMQKRKKEFNLETVLIETDDIKSITKEEVLLKEVYQI